MADINNIETIQDLKDCIAEYLKTPRVPPIKGRELGIINSKIVEFFENKVNACIKIDNTTPVANNDAAAAILGLKQFDIYITPTGEVRYKLAESGGDGSLWNDDEIWDDTKIWTD